MHVRGLSAGCGAVALGGLLFVAMAAAQKPEFKEFSIQPKYLTNHTTTTVHWAGTNFAGVKLTERGACKVLSYTSTATEIVMQIQSNRGLDDSSGYCNLYLSNRFGRNDAWVMVNFTDADQKQVKAAEQARGLQQIKEEMTRAGKEWTFHFGDGTTDVFRAGQPDANGVVTFSDAKGQQITILVMDDKNHDTVVKFPNDCNRMGTLENGRVTNGRSYLSCASSGGWTAEMK